MRNRSIGSSFGGFSVPAEGNITQSKGNKNQTESNNSQIINSSKIHHTFLLNKYPTTNATIPAIISSVNTGILSDESSPGNTGDTIATPNQNTEKLINQSAITESRVESNFFTTNNSNISSLGIQSFGKLRIDPERSRTGQYFQDE